MDTSGWQEATFSVAMSNDRKAITNRNVTATLADSDLSSPNSPRRRPFLSFAMGAYYDEIEIEDMSWDESKGVYHYPCPCGDRFEISRKQLANYEDIAICPSCSLIIRVIYDPVSNDSNVVESH